MSVDTFGHPQREQIRAEPPPNSTPATRQDTGIRVRTGTPATGRRVIRHPASRPGRVGGIKNICRGSDSVLLTVYLSRTQGHRQTRHKRRREREMTHGGPTRRKKNRVRNRVHSAITTRTSRTPQTSACQLPPRRVYSASARSSAVPRLVHTSGSAWPLLMSMFNIQDGRSREPVRSG